MVRYVSVLFFAVTLWVVVSCAEDEIQTQFYGYQIERLLSAEDTALWRPISVSGAGQGLTDCEDSVRLLITQLLDDSLDIYQLTPFCDGSGGFDTVALGKAQASTEEIFFTDSILFASGRYWIITEAFSLTFGFREGDVDYRYAIDN